MRAFIIALLTFGFLSQWAHAESAAALCVLPHADQSWTAGHCAAGLTPLRIHGPAAHARGLIAAEQAFEAKAVASGPAAAMRDTMDAADGLSFAGGDPARGSDAIYAAHGGNRPAGALTWVPVEVFVSEAGDMGATWGRFRFAPPAAAHGAIVTGRYVTVWRKDPAGIWKGIMDIGTPD